MVAPVWVPTGPESHSATAAVTKRTKGGLNLFMPRGIGGWAGEKVRLLGASVQHQRFGLEDVARDDVEHAGVRRGEDHRRRHARAVGFEPARGA